MSDALSIPLPRQIAGYTVHRELAAGRTYLAEAGGRRVILKRLEEDCMLGGALHPLIHDRLSRVRELAHLGVANLLGVEADGDAAYLVWEHVDGEPITIWASSIDTHRRVALARDLIAAVETLHALGIVHGEVHENNALVTPAGRVKLTHVSPLLYNETRVDVDAVRELLRAMGFNVDDCGGCGGQDAQVTLRELAAAVDGSARNRPSPAICGGCGGAAADDQVGRDRRGSLLAAALVAAAAASIAFGVWYWAREFSQVDEASPVPRAALERGAAS